MTRNTLLRNFGSALLDRINDQTRKTSTCWEFTGAKTAEGYGVIGGPRAAGVVYVHRAVWVLAGRKIPNGMFVLHKCDNRACRRLGHLFLGTAKTNAVDCAVKERTNRAKLSTSAIRFIRRVYQFRDPKTGGRALAEKFKVRPTTISAVVNFKSWEHVK